MSKLQTSATIPRGLDLARYGNGSFGEFTLSDAGNLTFDYGFGKVRLIGDYTANGTAGAMGGTVTGFTLSVVGNPIFTVSGLNADAVDFQAFGTETAGRDFFAAIFAQDDLIDGSKWRDDLRGFSGDDAINGGSGNDTINGNQGADFLMGGDGADLVVGGMGADTVRGGFGIDTLIGGTGNDLLMGRGGDDIIDAGAGWDRLRGGGGDDAFVFRAGFERDRVNDFEAGDHLVIADSLWDGIDNAADLVQAFGALRDGNAILDFGSDVIVIEGVTRLSTITAAIETLDFL